MSASESNVVVGYDGSPGADRALSWAAQEAARSDRELHIVAAVPTVLLDRHRRQLRRAIGTLLAATRIRLRDGYPKLTVRTVTAETSAAEALLDHTTEVDWLVVGRRGHGVIGDVLLGSVSLRVTAHAVCPVVVVPPTAQRGHTDDIVVGVGDTSDTPVFGFAAARARDTGAGIVAVHAWSLPVSGFAPELAMPLLSDAREMLAAHDTVLDQVVGAAVAGHDPLAVESRTVEDHPGHALTASAVEAALLVIGAHRKRGALPLRVSPTAHYVLHHAPCPVVLVPLGEARPKPRPPEPGAGQARQPRSR